MLTIANRSYKVKLYNKPMPGVGTTKHENVPQIPLNPPLIKGDVKMCAFAKGEIPLFGKEGLGEIFIVLCDGCRHVGFI
jgi:hypothetical protein